MITICHLTKNGGLTDDEPANSISVHCYKDIEDACNGSASIDVIVMDEYPDNTIQQWLRELRQNPKFSAQPILLNFPADPFLEKLTDGIVQSTADIIKISSPILKRLQQQLPLSNSATQEQCFLAFLDARFGMELIPKRNWRHENVYEYPIADFFFDHSLESLHELESCHFLSKKNLIDKLRACKFCSSSHLNYREECPHCSHIEIEQTPFMHCFTCGHIFPQQILIDQEHLNCPKCNAALKHIGIDYDRPLESYICHNCDEQFMDEEIKIQCLRCGRNSSPEKTLTREIYSLTLTDQGRRYAHDPQHYQTPALFSAEYHLSIAHFKSMLDWFIALQKKDPSFGFHVICIRILNWESLCESEEYQHLLTYFKNLLKITQSVINTTDIIAHSSGDTLFVFTPNTNTSESDKRLSKIKETLTIETQPDDLFQLIFTHYCSDEQSPLSESANTLLKKLSGRADND